MTKTLYTYLLETKLKVYIYNKKNRHKILILFSQLKNNVKYIYTSGIQTALNF